MDDFVVGHEKKGIYMSIWSRRVAAWAVATSALFFLLSSAGLSGVDAATLKEQMAKLQLVYFEESIDAPDFTLTTTDGSQLRLSDFKGNPILLNFWASW